MLMLLLILISCFMLPISYTCLPWIDITVYEWRKLLKNSNNWFWISVSSSTTLTCCRRMIATFTPAPSSPGICPSPWIASCTGKNECLLFFYLSWYLIWLLYIIVFDSFMFVHLHNLHETLLRLPYDDIFGGVSAMTVDQFR